MITIILVTYNRAKYIDFAIKDILNQTFQKFELIICDDASPDETEAVCRKWQQQDSRIKYIKQGVNKGMPENLNIGLRMAQYPYTAILHDGDRFPANTLERWYKALEKNPTAAFTFNPLLVYENNVINKSECIYPEGIVKKKDLTDWFCSDFRFSSPVWGEAMIRTHLLKEYGYLKNEFGFYADIDLWLGLLQKHDAYYCAEHLIHCPSKKAQPHQFDDRLIKVFFILVRIHEKHRGNLFEQYTFKRYGMLLKLKIQIIIGYIYSMLLMIKHYEFINFWDAIKLTYTNRKILLPIAFILIPVKIIYLLYKQGVYLLINKARLF